MTLHHYHFYVAEGLPQTQVLLWVYEDQLRAVVDSVVLAAYHCRYDGHTRHVRDMRHGIVYTTRVASPQGLLVPRHAEESGVVYRPKAPRRQGGLSFPAQQLWLFELGHTA